MSTNPLRSILVHLDGTARCAARLRLARQLAALHGSAVAALFAVAPRYVPLSVEPGVPTLPLIDTVDAGHRARAMKALQDAVADGAPATPWQELGAQLPVPGFVERAFLADLLVLGQRDPSDEAGGDVPHDFVESVIIDSGKPAWVLPYAGEPAADPAVVLVAWKPSRAAAHALAAALPLLRRARQVHLACASEAGLDPHRALPPVSGYLALHGIVPPEEHRAAGGADAGDTLLSLASDLGADLLVMGCYGHGRPRERILGGASRIVLHSMTLPVLMAH